MRVLLKMFNPNLIFKALLLASTINYNQKYKFCINNIQNYPIESLYLIFHKALNGKQSKNPLDQIYINYYNISNRKLRKV